MSYHFWDFYEVLTGSSDKDISKWMVSLPMHHKYMFTAIILFSALHYTLEIYYISECAYSNSMVCLLFRRIATTHNRNLPIQNFD